MKEYMHKNEQHSETILTKYIFMSQHHSLVNLRLSKPRSFLCREENLDSNILVTPFTLPDFTVSAFPNASNERYLFCYCSLNLETISNSSSHIKYF